ncbi:uncharacterized protein VTP21DRAFT_2562 [Calcarisporiella thermophila]|uniref:uncharacterized protein n=1 Tax=Calcarisporiella thermophila TaxID=911321 RepID=UPI003742D166
MNDAAVLEVSLQKEAVDELDGVERRVVRKTDGFLLPFLVLLLILCFLDRANIANARLAGLEKDLNLSEGQFLWCVAIYFFPYALSEIPSNIGLKRLRPSRWFAFIMISWGAAAVGMGFVKNFESLFATRFLLGMFEGGLFPGCVFYLSCWYRKRELATRLAIINGAASLANALGGLLAFGITRLGDPLRPWQWLFIIEGIPSVIAGFLVYFYFPDFPLTAKFLTEKERAVAVARLQKDARFDPHMTRTNKKYMLEVFKEPRVYLFALVGSTFTFALYALTNFLPTIINQMGHDKYTSQALTFAPNFVAFFVSVSIAIHSDHRFERGFHLAAVGLLGACGYLILMLARNNAVRYFAVFLVVAAMGSAPPIGLMWANANFYPAEKRAVAIGFIASVANCIGATGTQIYRKDDEPDYVRGHTILFCATLLTIILAFTIKIYLYYLNRSRERQSNANTVEMEGTKEVTDRDPDFRFAL